MNNLNQYKQPLNAPVTAGTATDNIQFDTQYQDNGITGRKIKNFNFSSGQGGTLTLGGTANGNGVMKVLTSGGGTAIVADNSGITIYGGNIVIKNVSNTTIIDTNGLVSTSNFTVQQITGNSGYSTTSLSYVDLPGATLPSFVLGRSSIVLITVFSNGYNVGRANNTSDSVNAKVTDSIDGDIITYSHDGNWIVSSIDFVGQGYNLDVTGDAVGISAYTTLSAGTHTMKIQYEAVTAGTAHINSYVLNYDILGS